MKKVMLDARDRAIIDGIRRPSNCSFAKTSGPASLDDAMRSAPVVFWLASSNCGSRSSIQRRVSSHWKSTLPDHAH